MANASRAAFAARSCSPRTMNSIDRNGSKTITGSSLSKIALRSVAQKLGVKQQADTA